MNELRKVLVVDDGRREHVDPLAAELLELGLSSVTSSLEAARDVLRVIQPPSAIIVHLPEHGPDDEVDRFHELADELRRGEALTGIPVVTWHRSSAFQAGGISAVLRTQYGPQVFATTEP